MTTDNSGTARFYGLVGFGSSVTNQVPLGNSIDLTGTSGLLLNFAFSVPRDGTITALTAYFSTSGNSNFGDNTVTVFAQLYQTTVPDNLFTPIAAVKVTLAPTLTGTVPRGTVLKGTVSGLSVPVDPETRLLLVFYMTSAGTPPSPQNLEGYASAGLAIS